MNTTPEPTDPDCILRGAIELALRAGESEPPAPAEVSEFLGQSDEHVSSLLEVLTLQRMLQSLPPQEWDKLVPPSNERTPYFAHRFWRSTAMAAAVGALALGAWLFHGLGETETFSAQTGELRKLLLDDRSKVDLNTNSEIAVSLTYARREIHLSRGEAMFTVADDPSRPFIVAAGPATIQALGTKFSVRLRPDGSVETIVTEGRVLVSVPPGAGSVLSVGKRAIVSGGTIEVSELAADRLNNKLAWTSGYVVFAGESLAEAVKEVNRYNRLQIVADESVAQINVGGIFNPRRPENFLGALRSLRLESRKEVGPDGLERVRIFHADPAAPPEGPRPRFRGRH